MSLESRIQAFDQLSRRFPCERLSPLISSYRIPEAAFERLRIAAMLYLCKCIPGFPVILEENELLQEFLRVRNEIKNITPNGMLVPKRHLILEYNTLVRAFMDIMAELNVGDFIASWHIPLNLRVKDGDAVKENLDRPHATETIHSDAWAGESSDSVAVYIGILGDIERNRVEFYEPPEDFKEEWLRPLETYRDGARIAERYVKTNIHQERGCVYLADFATMHATTRSAGSGPRLSIDTTFALKRTLEENERAEQKMHPWRKGERASHEILREIGTSKLFISYDSLEDIRPGHFVHPTRLEIVNLP